MVRAILNGSKTMTRRVVKLTDNGMAKLRGGYAQPLRDGVGLVWRPYGGAPEQPMPPDKVSELCPYGKVGDRLWVRETTRMRYMPNLLTGEPTNAQAAEYEADGEPVLTPNGFDYAWWYSRKSCPSIYMPRMASRLTLEITDVRVERLQDISEADAKAEGVSLIAEGQEPDGSPDECSGGHKAAFSKLWESINGPGSWSANPWVWALTFRRLEGGAA